MFLALLLAATVAHAEPTQTPDQKTWGRVSDAGVALTVGAGIFTQPDWESRGIAAGAQIVNYGFNVLLKWLFDEPRPDDPFDVGNPSGHVQMAAGGASQLCLAHEGWACAGGLVATGVVGTGRVLAGRHDVKQATTGFFVGWFMGRYPMMVLTRTF